APKVEQAPPQRAQITPSPKAQPAPPPERPAPPPAVPAAPITPEGERPQEERPWRLVGQVLDTYIIVEQGDVITLIDKHAAHERMWFDKLKAQDWRPMSQVLLSPQVFTPAPEEGAVLLEQLPLLEEFGFQVEDFGGGSLLLRQIPYDIDPDQAVPALSELARRLLTTRGRADPSAARDELLHTVACKAAIKGGQKNGDEELKAVAQAVLSGQVRYCPHGRPVAVELTRSALEKQFKRA
ncbi:MAG: DNA mismatch repair protein MutL, partial [Oscillospiraceae bacterium]|nr:DNA mismatch repair protein MutL [Oscillospiraceae bacterium]